MLEVSLVWDLGLQNKIELQFSFLSERYKVVMDMGSFSGQNLGDSNADPVIKGHS